MEEIAKADVFFVLTGFAVVLVTILVLAALYYVIKILRDVKDIAEHVKEESDEIISDIHSIRVGVKKAGKKLKNIIHPTSKKKKAKRSKKTVKK